MIEFTRAQLTHMAIHFVGNKGLGEELILGESLTEFTDDFVKETVIKYFVSPFKTDVYYQFRKKFDIAIDSVSNVSEDIFKSQYEFLEKSKTLAKILYDQSMHPKTAGGGFYVCYFRDVICDGLLTDAIGIFKTEKQATFLKLTENMDVLSLHCDSGIEINKLDKGCLIYNIKKDSGYKISIVDTNNKVAECALYWQEDFLNAIPLQNDYFNTKNTIDIVRAFLEEKVSVDYAMPKTALIELRNKAINHFNEITNFNQEVFETEVLAQKDLAIDFQEFKKDYINRMDLPKIPEEFQISATSVKQNKKHMREVIKLDSNFHLYIHSNAKFLEKGFDEEKGMKFYKVFFVNES